ncbi:MAG: hypothetical protein COU65_04455 [Candidatus Pacebacteria bacterium CG10_big_fil_rev_8_21_14_0_10_42_12]|nr:HAD family hydrolase [Candidatus Paceibacterota bacterium]PIR62218.1 MAG: hypothetical protein COU65_04455 [Candidatus Pacebacteria bacterium CG10_big_fil_rev_8_21_14_0_10_42_12]
MDRLSKYLEKNPKKALIFDFDGTLATIQVPWEVYAKEMVPAMEKLSKKHKRADFANTHYFENAVVAEIGEEAAKKRWQICEDFEVNELTGFIEHHEMTNFVRTHSENYAFVIWSSNARVTIEKTLKELDIFQHFSLLVTKTDVWMTKPNPEGFNLFIKQELDTLLPGWELEDVLMIGDSLSDSGAAKAVGMDFFQCTESAEED